MKVLVLAQDYPDHQGTKALMFVHVRNLAYKENGIDVTVLNFSSGELKYMKDGIEVISYKEYEARKEHYDILMSHAPNIRNHYRFLKKYQAKFKNIIFIFHGHEVLKTTEIYPKDYDFVKSSKMKRAVRKVYDVIKLKLWRTYFLKLSHKSHFVFVSHWMKQQFLKATKIDEAEIRDKSLIIYNHVGKIFQEEEYDKGTPKEYDFITIRGNLDGKKYSIDIVNELANFNPSLKFLVIGQGDFFNFVKKSENIALKNTTLNHKEMLGYINGAKCALMPTRTDAQGLMMCELEAFGIPVITSDIEVCREVFSGFERVHLIENDTCVDLKPILERLNSITEGEKNTKYFMENTVMKEIMLLKTLAEEQL